MSVPFLGEKVVAYIRLARPANIITAVSDILAGVSVSGIFITGRNEFTISPYQYIFWLGLSTSCLYSGGVVFNDVFDAELDKLERPERPIPRGLATVRGGTIMGIFLLVLGIYSAYHVSMLSAGIAIAVAFLSLAYDSFFKHHFLGPFIMGMCRAANLFLGISICPKNCANFCSLVLRR